MSDNKNNKLNNEIEGKKKEKALGLGVIFFLIAFAASFLAGTFIFPKLLYSKHEQPFSFDHVLHTAETGDCETCHFLREDGSFAGIPTLEICMECHTDEPLGESESEEIFVSEYVANEKEVPWHIYSRQPDCVFFSHAAHTEKQGMECKTCHGPIEESTFLKTYEENRLTGYSRDIWGKNIWGIKKNSWDSMKMDDCAKCHKKEMGHQGYCFQCHK